MARLYADEDFPYPVVLELRRLGHDVLTVQEAGKAGQKDEAVLDEARADGRAVLTHNRRDFIHLHHSFERNFRLKAAPPLIIPLRRLPPCPNAS